MSQLWDGKKPIFTHPTFVAVLATFWSLKNPNRISVAKPGKQWKALMPSSYVVILDKSMLQVGITSCFAIDLCPGNNRTPKTNTLLLKIGKTTPKRKGSTFSWGQLLEFWGEVKKSGDIT